MLDLESSDTSGSGQEEAVVSIQSMPSLMSLNVPPPPPIRRTEAVAVPGSGSPNQQLHILVISQPPGSTCSSSVRSGNAIQAVHLYPGREGLDHRSGPKRENKFGLTFEGSIVVSKRFFRLTECICR